jgi:6-phosphogluconolactonase
MRKIYAFALPSVLALIAGCGNSGSSTATPVTPTPTPPAPTAPAATSALYTQTNATTGNEVLAYSRASDGSLTSIGSYSTGGAGMGLPTYQGAVPIPSGGASGALAINPAGTFLYAVDAGTNDVAAFSVATDGTLTFIANYPTGGTSPGSITIDATGKYLYVLNTGTLPNTADGVAGGITGFTIGSSGALTAISGSTQPLSTGSYVNPSEVAFAPNGSYLMVTEKVSGTVPGTIDIYPVTAGVAGAPVSTPSTGAIPFGFAFTASGTAVVSNVVSPPGTNVGTATSYTATAQGVLTVVSASVADNQTQPCWMAINPAGTFAYTTNTVSGSVSAYAISSTGVLTLVPPPSGASSTALISASSVPIDDIVTPDGAYLYVIQSNAGAAPGQIVGFSISSTGALTSITGGVTGLPEGSLGLAVR